MVSDSLKTSRRHFDPHLHSLLLDYNALGYDRPFIFYCALSNRNYFKLAHLFYHFQTLPLGF